MEPRASKTDPAYQYHLRRYFSSGWAFLIPYLVAYLLYYVTKWPVNAVTENNQETGIGNQYTWAPCLLHVYWAIHAIHLILAGFALWSWWKRPKGSDVGGSSLAMSDPVSLEKETKDGTLSQTPPTSLPSVQTGLSPLTTAHCPLATDHCSLTTDHCSLSTTPRSSLLLSLAPWALLALLFYIPGVYLEWPSDPWEHLRRINEWRILDTVGAHSSWHKSAYFIPYSLLSWCIGLRQLFWLDCYYTGICLLLCWQYYKIARACGLGERASMVFVIIQALLFGNNIFSFYRYYGISSSIYAQLGAIALTRIVLEFAARGTNLEPGYGHKKAQEDARRSPEPLNAKNAKANPLTQRSRSKTSALRALCDLGVKIGSIIRSISQKAAKITKEGNPVGPSLVDAPSDDPFRTQSAPPGDSLPTSDSRHLTSDLRPLAASIRPLTSGFWHPASVLCLLSSGLCLTALTAFNHPQGLGIAGLGIAAIIIWRLIEWKRSSLWWLIGGTILINVLFLWLYPRPAIIETYRAQGWLNAWYGFDILDIYSPAGDRMLQIVSSLIFFNIAAAVLFLCRNHVSSWLTLLPFVLLLLPCISVPFSIMLSRHGDAINIITFQRMFFAVPPYLALVSLYSGYRKGDSRRLPPLPTQHTESIRYAVPYIKSAVPCIITVLLLLLALTLSPAGPNYARPWHALSRTAADLALKPLWDHITPAVLHAPPPAPPVFSCAVGEAIICAMAMKSDLTDFRFINDPPSGSLQKRFMRIGGIESSVRDRKTPGMASQFGPVTLSPSAWLTMDGDAPKFDRDATGQFKCLQTPVGKASEILTSTFFSIDQTKSYMVEMGVERRLGTQAVVYLAVAWYDANKSLLQSHISPPEGAGNPRGWSNGTYSYFGLVAQPAPFPLKKYKIDFGWPHNATIPSNAAYVRIGALLNYEHASGDSVRLCSVQIRENAGRLLLSLPHHGFLVTSSSFAAILSTHWPAQRVAMDFAGGPEFEAVARSLHAIQTVDKTVTHHFIVW